MRYNMEIFKTVIFKLVIFIVLHGRETQICLFPGSSLSKTAGVFKPHFALKYDLLLASEMERNEVEILCYCTLVDFWGICPLLRYFFVPTFYFYFTLLYTFVLYVCFGACTFYFHLSKNMNQYFY